MGFGAIEWLIICVVLVALAGTALVVYQRAHTPHDPYAGWKTYTSKGYDFSFRYPTNWGISGFRGADPVSASQMNGSETDIRLESSPYSLVDDFGIDLSPFSGYDGTPHGTYQNGTATLLPNGITLWQEKEHEHLTSGPAVNTCPALQVGTDDTFAQLLPSGNYLSVYGSFCWAERETTTKTYAEQVASPEWAAAIKIVKSIRSK